MFKAKFETKQDVITAYNSIESIKGRDLFLEHLETILFAAPHSLPITHYEINKLKYQLVQEAEDLELEDEPELELSPDDLTTDEPVSDEISPDELGLDDTEETPTDDELSLDDTSTDDTTDTEETPTDDEPTEDESESGPDSILELVATIEKIMKKRDLSALELAVLKALPKLLKE